MSRTGNASKSGHGCFARQDILFDVMHGDMMTEKDFSEDFFLLAVPSFACDSPLVLANIGAGSFWQILKNKAILATSY
jgi:hypothetical protein